MPTHMAVKRKILMPELDAAEELEVKLTAALDDLPRLLAYSDTAMKQFNEAFQITL